MEKNNFKNKIISLIKEVQESIKCDTTTEDSHIDFTLNTIQNETNNKSISLLYLGFYMTFKNEIKKEFHIYHDVRRFAMYNGGY